MKLSDKQNNFAQDVALFLQWCNGKGYKVTFGEVYRTQYQQDEYLRIGYSKAKHSKHQDRLAVDLNFFFDGVSMWDLNNDMLKKVMHEVGTKWEAMRFGNKWGGFFETLFDPGHFEYAG